MRREHRQPTRSEWAAITSRRPVVRVLEKRPGEARKGEVGRSGAKQGGDGRGGTGPHDREARKEGEEDPDEREDLWVESVRRYQERERRQIRAQWYGWHCD